MNPWRLLLRAGVVALVVAYPFAVVLGPREGLGVLLGAAVAAGNFALTHQRLNDTARLLRLPAAPGHRALTARTMISGTIRWAISFFVLWNLLICFHPLAVLGGLCCIVGAITLQASVDCLRAPRDTPSGAEP